MNMLLNVISFNIRHCNDKDGNSVAERAPRLYEIISRYSPDVIGFQELRPHWEPYLQRYFSKDYDMFCKYRSVTDEPEAAPILWRKDKFECINNGYFWLSDTPETESRGWDEVYNCYRMCEYVILRERESGKEFTFMNTHYGFGDNGQIKSSDLIYDYSKKISDLPTFITGDFNMTPESLGYAQMVKHFTDVNAATVNDTRDTFHNYQPEISTNQHIDFCFVNSKVKPISQKIIDDSVNGKYPSDHFGIISTIEI